MDPEFWHERWRQGQIGFHLPRVHPRLQRCWPRLGAEPGCRVFVPLCGKSRDMDWLARQGHTVVGVELSESAGRAFFSEHGRPAERRAEGALTALEDNEVRVLVGDFFDLAAADLADVGAVYDRAALIALPPELRRRYVAHMKRILPRALPTLVIGFDYDQRRMDGPPFSVPVAELRELYSESHEIELVEEAEILEHEPRFRERGLSALTEYAAVLRPR